MGIMLASLREERQQTYSCFLPIHPETGRVLYVPIKEVNAAEGTITFDDGSGRDWTLPVTGGNVKLQWKPDFGARWASWASTSRCTARTTAPTRRSTTASARCWGGRAPNHMIYELFLDEEGHKISKSKGNGLSIDEWLEFAATESLSYFMFQKPQDGEAAALGRDPQERGRVSPGAAGVSPRRTRRGGSRMPCGTSTAASRLRRTWWFRSRCS
jgi:lysyl-tRNA synthetase class 1